jgi:hypothetical protein
LGEVEIVDEAGEQPATVAAHGPGQFTGDVGQVTVPTAPWPPTSIARWGQMGIVSRQSDAPGGTVPDEIRCQAPTLRANGQNHWHHA